MNALLAFIPKPAMAGAIIILAIALGFTSCTVKRQAGEVAKATAAVAQAKETNDENLVTIKDITKKLADAVEGRRADEALQIATAHKWEVERGQLEARANEIQTESIEVYRDPTCSDLAKINIAAICPDLVFGMRQRADRVNESRNRPSPRPSEDATRP